MTSPGAIKASCTAFKSTGRGGAGARAGAGAVATGICRAVDACLSGCNWGVFCTVKSGRPGASEAGQQSRGWGNVNERNGWCRVAVARAKGASPAPQVWCRDNGRDLRVQTSLVRSTAARLDFKFESGRELWMRVVRQQKNFYPNGRAHDQLAPPNLPKDSSRLKHSVCRAKFTKKTVQATKGSSHSRPP